MKTTSAVLCFSLAYVGLAYLDTATTLAGFERGHVSELNPSLSPTLGGQRFWLLFTRDLILAALWAVSLAWSWDKRHRFASVEGELTFRTYYKNYERLPNVPVFVALMLPLVAIGMKLLAVLNNGLIVTGIGSPYSAALRAALRWLPLSARQLHVVMMGLLGVALCYLWILWFYREARRV
jgi:hypothetical protein